MYASSKDKFYSILLQTNASEQLLHKNMQVKIILSVTE